MSFELISGTTVDVEPPEVPRLLQEPPSAQLIAVTPPAIPTASVTVPVLPRLVVNPPVPGNTPIIIVPGPPGPPGLPGAPGGSSFVYTQDTPSAAWIINHGLGRLVHVTLIDSSSDIAYADVIQGTPNQATIIFAQPATGSAFLS